jgi:hypothetical protein
LRPLLLDAAEDQSWLEWSRVDIAAGRTIPLDALARRTDAD